MIDKAKLNESFKYIGENRLPHYINLYLQENSNFISNAQKLYSRQKWEKLSELIHKTKGSFSIFCDYELGEKFSAIEKMLTRDMEKNIQREWQELMDEYSRFICELNDMLNNIP